MTPKSNASLEDHRTRSWRRYALVFAGVVLVGVLTALVATFAPAPEPDYDTWATLTPAARQALARLREPSGMQWYVVPLLAIVMYIYAAEIERRQWKHVFAGLALFGVDWFNEIWNALVLHFTRRSAVWLTPTNTAFVIFAGWTIEIAFMFAIAGIVFAKLLHEDRYARLLGVPNRWFWAVAMSLFAVFVEVLLNRAGLLVWEWPWWNWPNVWLIIVFGYLHFFVVAFLVYDMKSIKAQITTVSCIYAFDAAATLAFSTALGWI